MGLLSGALTMRRFRVVGTVPEAWRERVRDQLTQHAFREPTSRVGKEETEGWVQVHNLLDTDFSDFNTWLHQQHAVFALRVDKKVLPGRLLRAHVDLRCKKWCEEKGVSRVPASVRTEIKEKLEEEWLDRALPRVAVTELCWHVAEGWVILAGLSDSVADRIRKRFHRSFGLELVDWSPLDAIRDRAVRDDLMNTSATLGGEA